MDAKDKEKIERLYVTVRRSGADSYCAEAHIPGNRRCVAWKNGTTWSAAVRSLYRELADLAPITDGEWDLLPDPGAVLHTFSIVCVFYTEGDFIVTDDGYDDICVTRDPVDPFVFTAHSCVKSTSEVCAFTAADDMLWRVMSHCVRINACASSLLEDFYDGYKELRSWIASVRSDPAHTKPHESWFLGGNYGNTKVHMKYTTESICNDTNQ